MCLSGHQVVYTLVTGLPTTRMDWVSFPSKAGMSTQESSSQIKDKVTGTTSGQIIESSRVGGTRTSSMD